MKAAISQGDPDNQGLPDLHESSHVPLRLLSIFCEVKLSCYTSHNTVFYLLMISTTELRFAKVHGSISPPDSIKKK